MKHIKYNKKRNIITFIHHCAICKNKIFDNKIEFNITIIHKNITAHVTICDKLNSNTTIKLVTTIPIAEHGTCVNRNWFTAYADDIYLHNNNMLKTIKANMKTNDEIYKELWEFFIYDYHNVLHIIYGL